MKWRRLPALAVALALTLGLTACTGLGGVTEFDATRYVRGLLDEGYHGVYDDAYLQLVNSTQDEGEQAHRAVMDVAYAYFCTRFSIDDAQITQDTRDLLRDLLAQVYRATRYDVHAAAALDGDEYAVRVTVYPVTVLAEILADDYPAAVKSFDKLYADTTDEMLAAMHRTERAEFWRTYEDTWANQVAKLLQARIGTLTRGEGEVMLVRVYSEDGAAYTVSDRERALLDELLVAY